ncbi:MAG TPA: DUF4267 domain-containing protein [Dehalococcoidia bacterium]|nr:DUF4267 domain-containing protein [Dehalococcoidia bacterium]
MLVRLIGACRVAVGLLIIARPRLAARLFALPEAGATADARFVTRIAGNRDLMLGAALLLAPAAQTPPLLGACVAVDAADLLVALGSAGASLRPRSVLSNVVVAGAAATGEFWALDRARRARRF